MNKLRRRVRAPAQFDLDEILPEYDFSRARPNKYAARNSSASTKPKPEREHQESDQLDAEAIFTLGFNDEQARQAFIAEMDDLTRVP